MIIVSKTGAGAVSIPGLGTVEAGPDGGFDVPHEVGVELLAFGALWRLGDVPPPAEVPAEVPAPVKAADTAAEVAE